MNLTKKINDDIKAAMLSRDKEKLEALRAIKAALLLARTGKDVKGGEISRDKELKLLQQMVKQRKESAEIYKSQNRQDLADVELFQAAVIEKYLPEKITEQELEKLITQIISETGASSMKDMGKVMGIAAKKLIGKADNKTISVIVKKLLA